jgi:glucose/arabinose dehydrogenase
LEENEIVHVAAQVAPGVQNADGTTSPFGRQAAVVGPTAATGLPAGFRDERVAGGSDLPIQFQLNTPVTLAFLPDGRLLVTEKGGKLRLIKDNLVQPAAVLDLKQRFHR